MTAGLRPVVIEVAIAVVTVRAQVRVVELGEVISVELDEPSQHRSVGSWPQVGRTSCPISFRLSV